MKYTTGVAHGEMTIQNAIDNAPIKRLEAKTENISDTQYLDSIFESDMKNFQRYSKRIRNYY